MTTKKDNKGPALGAVTSRWNLVRNDLSGTDRDIAALVRRLQDRHAFTHDQAEAELLRRVSSGRDPGGDAEVAAPTRGPRCL